MNLILGIDPGMSGGAAIVSSEYEIIHTVAFKKLTPTDISNWLKEFQPRIRMAYIEGVSAMPKQGVTSMFKFGMNYGWWQGVLVAHDIPFQRIYPLRWQTALSCRTGGNKNITKTRAQELFPNLKITHNLADALLIAEYGRRQQFRPAAVSDL